MRRRIIALGLAGLMTLNVTATPVSAADLGMPLKAPPIVAPPPEVDIVPIMIAVALAAAIGACVALCPQQSCNSPPC
jgi:hypothetical protein